MNKFLEFLGLFHYDNSYYVYESRNRAQLSLDQKALSGETTSQPTTKPRVRQQCGLIRSDGTKVSREEVLQMDSQLGIKHFIAFCFLTS